VENPGNAPWSASGRFFGYDKGNETGNGINSCSRVEPAPSFPGPWRNPDFYGSGPMNSSIHLLRRSWLFSLLVLGACMGALELAPDDSDQVLARHLLDVPSPLEQGSYRVKSLFYGSGTDKNRPEFRDSVAFETGRVDASKLVSLGRSEKSRNKYWGFEPDSFPVNARVWYPDGKGPFPLVLVAHGNHNMKDFSDPGYEYLGRHLASRGFILASLDMNFINGGIGGENDGRGWLFLKHLEAWAGFNEDPENPFHGLVDMENLGIMGHSRGGEAVSHAAAFNNLSRYPDDATLTWEFGFDIKAVIAIAPVDGQYRPTSRLAPVENVNYLVFHGTHDGDVSRFSGLRTYKEEQRQFALVYVTAFLESSLRGRDDYLPMFRDHRVIGDWLPKTMFITQFQESGFRPLATFEGDIDVTTGAIPGVRIRGDSLATWKEDVLPFRSRTGSSSGSTQENQAVWVGWNNRIAGKDTTRMGPPAAYALELPDGLGEDWDVGPGTTLDFMLTALDQTPRPRKDPAAEKEKEEGGEKEDPEEGQADEGGEGRGGKSRIGRFFSGIFSSLFSGGDEDDEDEEKPPLSLSVQLVDADGHSGKVLLNRYGPVRRPIEIRLQRRDDQQYSGNTEMVLQSYSIPLADFRSGSSAGLDLSRISEIRFLFDESKAGTVVLDEVGLSQMDPAFLRVSASR